MAMLKNQRVTKTLKTLILKWKVIVQSRVEV